MIDNSEQLALSLNPDMLAPSAKQSGSKEKSKATDTKVSIVGVSIRSILTGLAWQEKSKKHKDESSIVGLREKHAKGEQSAL